MFLAWIDVKIMYTLGDVLKQLEGSYFKMCDTYRVKPFVLTKVLTAPLGGTVADA